jgi:hypothetical protein
MTKDVTPKKRNKSKFINDKVFNEYTQPKMLDAAQEMLCNEEISEEGFLGAQAVLLLNGVL